MTVRDAVNWCNGQVGKALDYDRQYSAQCTDFFNFYYQLITTREPYADGYGVPGAKDIWNVSTNRFNKIANDPNDPNQLPPQGSILIYDGGLPGSEGFGHVAIVDTADAKNVTVWDQNWGGQYVHHQAHMWTGHETGWLVFKGFEPEIPMISLDQLNQVYESLLKRLPDAGGIDHYVGHFTYDFTVNDIKNSEEYKTLQTPPPAPPPPPEVLPDLTNQVPEPSPVPTVPPEAQGDIVKVTVNPPSPIVTATTSITKPTDEVPRASSGWVAAIVAAVAALAWYLFH